jgi:hypothetical protein
MIEFSFEWLRNENSQLPNLVTKRLGDQKNFNCEN